MTKVYYKHAIAGVIVYDVTRPETFEGVSKASIYDIIAINSAVEEGHQLQVGFGKWRLHSHDFAGEQGMQTCNTLAHMVV